MTVRVGPNRAKVARAGERLQRDREGIMARPSGLDPEQERLPLWRRAFCAGAPPRQRTGSGQGCATGAYGTSFRSPKA